MGVMLYLKQLFLLFKKKKKILNETIDKVSLMVCVCVFLYALKNILNSSSNLNFSFSFRVCYNDDFQVELGFIILLYYYYIIIIISRLKFIHTAVSSWHLSFLYVYSSRSCI